MKKACRNLFSAHWPMCFFLALSLVLAATMPVWAQFTTARLSGTITDQSGAVVAGATIVVQDVGTTYSQTTSSTSVGQYLFPSLPVGTYQITVSAAGYKPYVQKGLVLSVGQAATQNVQLQVGMVSQQVEVTANSTLVTTDSATVGQLIDQKQIAELPLNGRYVQELVFLAPGTTNVTANYCAANCEGGVFPSEQYAKVNGGGANGVNYLLDGVDANDTYINTNVPFPNPDALEEFNLVTGSMSAAYGNAIGGVVNVVTKSGTDQFHGDIFEFFQNSALNASNYFSAGLVNPLRQNQFGGSIGGPILKNHLFFFGSYQGTRFRTANNGQIASVPNAAERTGDFSDLLAAGIQLTNPATGANYTNNQIPVSPVATYILNHIPLPNGPNDLLTFNGGPEVQDTNEYLAKVDFNFGKHHLSGHYFQMNYTKPIFIPPPSNLLQLRADAEDLVLRNISVVDIYTISPRFLLNSYFGYNSVDGTTLSSAPFSMADAGSNIAVPPNLGGGNGPVLQVTVGGDFTLLGTPYGVWNRNDQSLREVASWIKGKHELQFGGELVRIRLPMGNQYQQSGVYDFESLTGSPLADFELGAVSAFTQGGGLFLDFTGYRESLFVQDNWKATPRLLLSAGLRWDPFFPYTDSLGRVACFVPGAQSQRFPNAPVGMLFGGSHHDPGCPASSIYNNPKNFGPRLGFAYRLTENGNTSVRGGAGYYYEAPNTVAFEDVVGIPPFAPIINLSTISPPTTPPTPWVSVEDPYGSQGAENPFPGQFGPLNPGPNATFPSSGISFSQIFDRHFRLPMVLAWNLTVEHGFQKDWLLRLAYVGNNGHHLNGTGDQENGLLQLNPPGNPVYPFTQVPGTTSGYGSIASINSGVNSNYNALQITLQKRPTHGVSFLTNFTWSKELNDFAPIGGSPYLTNSCSCGRYFDYGPSDDDISKTFKFTGEYMIPRVSLPKVVDTVVNGWQLSGTVNWQTGSPFSIFSGADNSGSGMLGDRADLAVSSVQQAILGSSGRSHAEQVAEWFNTSAFQPNAMGTFGDTGKNILSGPRYFAADLAVVKNFKITERFALEFRGEFFNAFNNVNFGKPDGNLADLATTYGQITGLAGASSSNTYGTAQPRVIQFALKLSF